MRPLNLMLLLTTVLTLPALADTDHPTLTVVTWGGAYERSQYEAYFESFTEKTGIEVETVRFNGGLDALKEAYAKGNHSWDVIDMIKANADTACEQGLLRELDPSILAPAPDGTPASEDFIKGAIGRCAVTQLVFSTVIAYDDRAFPGVKPRRVEDFFDTQRFPGRRALRRAPVGLFEWALMSQGVPRSQLYDLLSTERGLDLAFNQLDKLRGQLTWWTGGNEPARLLAEGKVAMASGYNGRFFDAQVNDGAPITIIWDGQLLDYNSWAIPAQADQPQLAERFIRYATRAEPMAHQASLISYSPARHSARERVGLHKETSTPMRLYLPTLPAHLEKAIHRDQQWYTQTFDLRWRLFERWMNRHDTQD
ncbi:ABC transporter substrate-binding protein [Chromohalobacter sp. 296-RDG]|uniref:ABC transporter substrate-binding protein n=1 Tax=Chromohalobacter sp. 296-RDG TaxID=2994062 RepID=UPI002469A3D8|nr:ABC transporter substrate-binding protein [Chromohalobacter sp. 296-RDG]